MFKHESLPLTSRLDKLDFPNGEVHRMVFETARKISVLTQNVEERFAASATVVFHGTGVASIYHLLKFGVLPVREQIHERNDSTDMLLRGRIFLMPKMECDRSDDNHRTDLSQVAAYDKAQREGAEFYARESARVQYLFEKLNLGYDRDTRLLEGHLFETLLEDLPVFRSPDPEYDFLYDTNDIGVVQKLIEVEESYFARLAGVAKMRKGFLLGISEKVFDDYEHHIGDEASDLAIVCPQGLPLSYITAIKPRGYWETAWLGRMESVIGKGEI